MLLLAELHEIIDVVGLRSAILLFSICLTPFLGSFEPPAFFCVNQNFFSYIFLTFLLVFSTISLLHFFSDCSQDYSIHLGLITIYFNIESLLVKALQQYSLIYLLFPPVSLWPWDCAFYSGIRTVGGFVLFCLLFCFLDCWRFLSRGSRVAWRWY